jgi:hypothetical protein
MTAELTARERDQTLAVSGVVGVCGLPRSSGERAVVRRTALRTVSGSARSRPFTGPLNSNALINRRRVQLGPPPTARERFWNSLLPFCYPIR